MYVCIIGGARYAATFCRVSSLYSKKKITSQFFSTTKRQCTLRCVLMHMSAVAQVHVCVCLCERPCTSFLVCALCLEQVKLVLASNFHRTRHFGQTLPDSRVCRHTLADLIGRYTQTAVLITFTQKSGLHILISTLGCMLFVACKHPIG